MPGPYVHYRICTEAMTALKDRADEFPIMKKIWDTTFAGWAKAPSQDPSHYATHHASFAYLGSFGPDIFYMPPSVTDAAKTNPWADLLHYNKTGTFVISQLYKLRQFADARPLTETEEYKLAYLIGHTSHVSADSILHPFVNSMAGTYHAQRHADEWKIIPVVGWFGVGPGFTVHNKIEQNWDAWHHINYYKPRFRNLDVKYDIKKLNFPKWAVEHMRKNKLLFLKDAMLNTYDLDVGLGSELENLEFFDIAKMIKHDAYPGSIPETPAEVVVRPEVFRAFLQRAKELNVKIWTEILEYIYKRDAKPTLDALDKVSPLKDGAWTMHSGDRKYFPLLASNWNLDIGMAIEVSEGPKDGSLPKTAQIPVTLTLKSSHKQVSREGQPIGATFSPKLNKISWRAAPMEDGKLTLPASNVTLHLELADVPVGAKVQIDLREADAVDPDDSYGKKHGKLEFTVSKVQNQVAILDADVTAAVNKLEGDGAWGESFGETDWEVFAVIRVEGPNLYLHEERRDDRLVVD